MPRGSVNKTPLFWKATPTRSLRRFSLPYCNIMRPSTRLLSVARTLRVLGIESSADDSCAAVVDSSRRILSNVVMKQHDIHGELQHDGVH